MTIWNRLQFQTKLYAVLPMWLHLSLLACLWSRICEICGAVAVNIIGGQASEPSNATIAAVGVSSAPVVLSETRRFWHGRRIMNFLLACMIFAFVISWLFHFKIFPWISFKIILAGLVLSDIINDSTMGEIWCRGIFGLRNFNAR